MTTWSVKRDGDQTLTPCDWCQRAYPLREMASAPHRSGHAYVRSYKCRECQGKREDDE